jgi:hypothetical protein
MRVNVCLQRQHGRSVQSSSMATILDVIDNFWASKRIADIAIAPGKVIDEFGVEVRRFAGSYSPPNLESKSHPIYLGGWPSANVWGGAGTDLVMSSLLYCGQILGKDPISDWFSDDQYHSRHLLAARPGYLDPSTGQPNMAATRAFLPRVIDGLRAMRPLIEKEIVVLVPSHAFVRDSISAVSDLERRLLSRVVSNVDDFVRQFAPQDLATEDNVRGMFAFAGGNEESQIREKVGHSLRYFASEYLLAQHHRAAYTAPFEYEQYLCAAGLEEVLRASEGERVVHALLTSRLPLFSRLSPSTVANVREDEQFGLFRSRLYEMYGHLSPTATPQNIAEAEDALLTPILKQIERQGKLGRAGSLGVEWLGLTMRIGSTLLMPPISTVLAGMGELLGRSARATEISGAVTVWTKLFAHGRRVEHELETAAQPGQNLADSGYWGIPPQPSMSVTVAPGILLVDTLPGQAQMARMPPQGANRAYDPCSCGSGLKRKFCCRGIPVRHLC